MNSRGHTETGRSSSKCDYRVALKSPARWLPIPVAVLALNVFDLTANSHSEQASCGSSPTTVTALPLPLGGVGIAIPFPLPPQTNGLPREVFRRAFLAVDILRLNADGEEINPLLRPKNYYYIDQTTFKSTGEYIYLKTSATSYFEGPEWSLESTGHFTADWNAATRVFVIPKDADTLRIAYRIALPDHTFSPAMLLELRNVKGTWGRLGSSGSATNELPNRGGGATSEP